MKFRASLKSFTTNKALIQLIRRHYIQHGVSRHELMQLHTSGLLSMLLQTKQVQVL